MSDEIRVSIEPDKGIKNQWARGLFYRNDGKKKTFLSNHFLGVCLGGFFVMAITLLLQETPTESKPIQKTTWASPSDIQAERVENIPTVVAAEKRTNENHAPRTNVNRNRQTAIKLGGPQLVSRPRLGKIPPGSMLKATLLTGGSNGPVRAEVTEGLIVNGETLIEEGTILLGSGQSGEDRLSIRFSQMLFKDGAFDSIDAQACDDTDKIAGIKGSKVGGQALKLGMGIGLNFAGGATTALQDPQGQGGVEIRRPTLKNALLNGAATAALDQSREVMSDTRNKAPVIEVPAGTSIYVLFQGS